MNVSVIISTKGKAHYLRSTLESLKKQNIKSWIYLEVILVDNNTKPIIEKKFEKLIDSTKIIKVFHEGRTGQSIALNKGISLANGDLILFTDDDAVLSKNWVSSYVDSIKYGDTEIGYLFGPIIAKINTKKNKIDKRLLPRSHAGFSLGKNNIEFNAVLKEAFPVGVNMALTRNAIKKGFRFDERLGPGSKLGLSYGADILIGKRLLQEGLKGIYVADAFVNHIIPDSRLSFYSLCKRKFEVGKSVYMYDNQNISCFAVIISLAENLIMFFVGLFTFNKYKMHKEIIYMLRNFGFLNSYINRKKLR